MSDPEVWRRRDAISLMSSACECVEHAPVALTAGYRGQVDVLCRPVAAELSGFALAIEVKAHQQVGDKQLGPWLKQAADYVGALPENGWPQIVASFVWLVGMDLHPNKDEQLRMDGMIQLAQHFRVGRAVKSDHGLYLVFGPSAAIFYRGIWTPRAVELLTAKRVRAGQRARIN